MVDTAGVRKKRNVTDDLETLMVKSSMEAVRTSDVVLMMIDASQGQISDQELKLLFYAYEQKKIMLILFNKSDLVDEYARVTLEQSLDEYEFILKKIPQIWTSCLTKRNVNKVLNEVKTLWERCHQEFNSTEVNEIVQAELATKPLYHTKIALRVFKIRVIKASIPTFVLHVNHPAWFGDAEQSCIENILRKNFDLRGCPIQLSIRKV
jgi:GTP-binding protein